MSPIQPRSLGVDKIPRILRSRRILVGTCTLGLAGFVILIHMILPPKYKATASIVLESRDHLLGVVVPTAVGHSTMIATHSNIVGSERVAGRVVDELKLAEDPVRLAAWQATTKGEGNAGEWIAASILGKLSVRAATPDSNVLNITYTDRDAAHAAAMANAFAKAYLDTQLELHVSPSRQVALFFEDKVKANRGALQAAQARLSAFQREHNIAVVDERLDVETAVLNELATDLADHRTSQIDSLSRIRHAADNLETSPDVIQSSVVRSLTTEVARDEAHLKGLSSRFGPAHPHYRAAEEHLAELKVRLREESKRVADSIAVGSKAGRQGENSVEVALYAQRKRVLDLKNGRDELAMLERDLESAKKVYDQTMLRLSESTRESESLISDAMLLTAARVPSESSWPRPALTVPLGAAIGLIGGLLIALMLEHRAPRIRTVEDVVEVFDMPVLASVPQWRRSNIGKGHRAAKHSGAAPMRT